MAHRQECNGSNIITVGLTGGIGSGKSAVAAFLEICGAVVIYADSVARGLVDKNISIKKSIIRKFGRESYRSDGHLDRPRMSALVFRNQTLQNALNAIVHPATILAIDKTMQELKNKNHRGLVVVEAALIFEAGVEKKYDYIIVVDAPQNVRIRRMMKRDKTSEKDIRARMKSQLPNRDKSARADIVIKNSGSICDLQNATQFVYNMLMRSL